MHEIVAYTVAVVALVVYVIMSSIERCNKRKDREWSSTRHDP